MKTPVFGASKHPLTTMTGGGAQLAKVKGDVSEAEIKQALAGNGRDEIVVRAENGDRYVYQSADDMYLSTGGGMFSSDAKVGDAWQHGELRGEVIHVDDEWNADTLKAYAMPAAAGALGLVGLAIGVPQLFGMAGLFGPISLATAKSPTRDADDALRGIAEFVRPMVQVDDDHG